eukprot:TRINITY_DN6303_c0_g1_i1.p1 TRINITY_DN6303_c0_g1~~TRINITY_DN6303_c0_g1_i1.p1  ORF type:complete len:367 (+),score=93.65 TRINITY_DN6303_c0_g1_i1:97-1197(+)
MAAMWPRLVAPTAARLGARRVVVPSPSLRAASAPLATCPASGGAALARRQAVLRQRLLSRAFCAEVASASPLPRSRRSKGPKASAQIGKGVAFVLAGTGVAYAVNSDVRENLDGIFGDAVEWLEDLNDTSREFFESCGDRLVAKREEPWLLELATMKYPENIPTLVLDLDKVILKLEHDSRQGWHVIKRPFADQFFKEISHYYEVVIFSDDVFPVALDIATKWNLPVTGVLHRDFCKKKRSHYVKDISKLGRDLRRVVVIDHEPEAFQLQPENGILIKAFNGDTSDSELHDLLEFLKAAATANCDVRQYIQKFGGGDPDIGRRYLLHKQDQDQKVEQRRSVGRYFSASRGFPGSQGGANTALQQFR